MIKCMKNVFQQKLYYIGFHVKLATHIKNVINERRVKNKPLLNDTSLTPDLKEGIVEFLTFFKFCTELFEQQECQSPPDPFLYIPINLSLEVPALPFPHSLNISRVKMCIFVF